MSRPASRARGQKPDRAPAGTRSGSWLPLLGSLLIVVLMVGLVVLASGGQ